MQGRMFTKKPRSEKSTKPRDLKFDALREFVAWKKREMNIVVNAAEELIKSLKEDNDFNKQYDQIMMGAYYVARLNKNNLSQFAKDHEIYKSELQAQDIKKLILIAGEKILAQEVKFDLGLFEKEFASFSKRTGFKERLEKHIPSTEITAPPSPGKR